MIQTGSKGGRAQERILESAIRLFARDGQALTSFQAIADDCGLKQTAILYHFKNRDGLIAAAIERVVMHNHAIVSNKQPTKGDPIDLLRNHFRQNFMWAARYPAEAQVILLLYYQSTHDPATKALYRKIRRQATHRIEVHLLEAKNMGIIKPDTHVGDLAHLLHDALLGGIVNFVTTRSAGETFKQVGRKWELLFSQFLKKNDISRPKN